MKTLPLAAISMLAGLSAIVVASDSAKAQSWMDIARQPVPSYQPFRGYNGAQTYIGQDYTSPGGANTGGAGGALATAPGDDWAEDAEESNYEDHDADCF
jgi:hypothetical protein